MRSIKEIPLNKRAFEVIDSILYVFELCLSESGLSVGYYRKEKSLHSQRLCFLNHPKDKRFTLVAYETISPAHQEKIKSRYGNPYERVAKDPIKQFVELDPAAEKFYKSYRYDNDKFLPIKHCNKYTQAASWLNMLAALNEDKKIIKKELKLPLDKFWLNVCDIIKTDDIELPSSYNRLLAKVKEYANAGYECLIDWRFGNKNSAKIGKSENGYDEDLAYTQVALIRKAASMHNNFDAQQIATAVGTIYEKNNWPVISKATVYNVMKANKYLTLAGSKGKREYNSSIAMQRKRSRPEFPLYYLTLDGWVVELLYQENNTFNNRLVVVVVLDAMNNYPLGYAIGDRENTDLIRQANRNALIHINELLGNYYQPKQIQSDHYGLKSLTPFYQAMAHLHTPAAVGNAKSKVIEPYFKYLNKKYCQLLSNWSGFGITSRKENQPNTEFLNIIKNSFPDKAGVVAQIEMIMQRERQIKQVDYCASWLHIAESDKLPMCKMDMLMVYGTQAKYLNTITGAGLIVTINGEKNVYDSFDPTFRANQHLKWQVIYDDHDLSSILVVSQDNKRRFVLDSKRVLPMDVYSTTDDDRRYDKQISEFNKDRMKEVIQTYAADNLLVAKVIEGTPLALNDIDEANLKLMFTYNGQQKEKLQDAKGLRNAKKQKVKRITIDTKNTDQQFTNDHIEFLEGKTDFNQYKD